jgi:AcrR family transcriptional regulator
MEANICYRRFVNDVRTDSRIAIMDAAALLLREYGAGAVTTRRVAELAGTQAPTIYRLFGDKDGLLDAVADHVMATYVAVKTSKAAAEITGGRDPLDDLRAGYRLHLEFGLANPELFALISARRTNRSAVDVGGQEVLHSRVHRLAAAGRLRVSEQRAVEMVSAAGNGAVLIILGTPESDRDLTLGEAMFEAVLGVILTSAPTIAPAHTLTGAVSLAAVVPQLPTLTSAERELMSEWLHRSITELQHGPFR